MVWDIHFHCDKLVVDNDTDSEDEGEEQEPEESTGMDDDEEEEEDDAPKDENGRTFRERKALEYFCIFEKGYLDKKKEQIIDTEGTTRLGSMLAQHQLSKG